MSACSRIEVSFPPLRRDVCVGVLEESVLVCRAILEDACEGWEVESEGWGE